MRRRILLFAAAALVLAALLAPALQGGGASADDASYGAYVEDADGVLTYYETFEEALASVESSGTITLLGDAELEETAVIGDGVSLTLYLNGCALSLADGCEGQVLCVEGSLALYDLEGGTTSAGTVTGGSGESYGGGVYVASGASFTMYGGTITGNSASYGAGVYSAGSFAMHGGSVSGNEASLSGGGVYVASGSAFLLYGGSVAGNEAGSYGGGVYARGTVEVSGGSVSGNSAKYGGGVSALHSGTVEVSGGSVSGNSATYGAGVYVMTGGSVSVSGGSISGNSADCGGGIYATSDGSVSVSGGSISGNSADCGGGIYATSDGSVSVSGGSISGNSADCGGGIYSSGYLELSGGEISGNDATYGGGVYCDGDFAMSGGAISGNSAEEGGGVYLDGSGNEFEVEEDYAYLAYQCGNMHMSGGEITGNTADNRTGGVSVDNGTLYVSGSAYIAGNYCDGDSCGVGFYDLYYCILLDEEYYDESTDEYVYEVECARFVIEGALTGAIELAYLYDGGFSSSRTFAISGADGYEVTESDLACLAYSTDVTGFTVSFELDGEGGASLVYEIQTYTVTVTAEGNGSVDASGVDADYGTKYSTEAIIEVYWEDELIDYFEVDDEDELRDALEFYLDDADVEVQILYVLYIGNTTVTATADGASGDVCYYWAFWSVESGMVAGDMDVTVTFTAVGHDYEATATGSCTEGIIVTYTCSVCGDSYTEALDATDHDYVAVVTDPTCTEEGYTTYVCSVCGDSYIDEDSYTDPTGHSYVLYESSDATCTHAGYLWYRCENGCGSYIYERLAKTDHDYVASVTEPTCTEQGYTTYTCSSCGDSYVDEDSYTDPTGHSYLEFEVSGATCTEAGLTVHVCENDASHFYFEIVEAAGHDYAAVVIDPTCTEQGYTEYVCAGCGDSYVDEDSYTDALGHDYAVVVTDPTCTEQGYTMNTCSSCGDSYVDDYTDALGHTYVATETVEATCTEDGCTVYACSVCGDSYTEVAEAAGHSYETVYTEPTCTGIGYTRHVCSVCGDAYVSDVCSPTGHSYEATETVDATCTEDGYTVYTCSACGDSYTVTAGATGHSFVSTDGSYVCSSCGLSYALSEGSVVIEVDSSIVEVAAAEGDGITLVFDGATASLDSASVAGLSGTVYVGFSDVSGSVSGDQYGDYTCELSMCDADGEAVTDLEGTVTVTLAVAVADGCYAVVYYVDGGTLVEMETAYTSDSVTFTTTHFSEYTVYILEEDAEGTGDTGATDDVGTTDDASGSSGDSSDGAASGTSSEESGDDSGSVLIMAAVLVVAIAAIAVAVVFIKRRRRPRIPRWNVASRQNTRAGARPPPNPFQLLLAIPIYRRRLISPPRVMEAVIAITIAFLVMLGSVAVMSIARA